MSWVPWTAEASDQLVKLVADGLTAGTAADKLGVTRCAAIGRARRMHLKWATPPAVKGVKKPKQKRVRVIMARLPELPPPPPWHGKPLELTELTPYSCRWPVGPGDRWTLQRFCGAPCGGVEHNHPYCRAHEEKAWRSR